MSVENAPGHYQASPVAVYNWASHLVLSPLIGEPLSPQKQSQYLEWLNHVKTSEVHRASIRFNPTLPYWGMSFGLRVRCEETALEVTAETALGGLLHAGVDVRNLEYISCNLASRTQLQADNKAAHAAGEDGSLDIADHRYQLQDRDSGYNAFMKARNFYTELAALRAE